MCHKGLIALFYRFIFFATSLMQIDGFPLGLYAEEISDDLIPL